jgi:hypothetical protein
MTEIRNNKQKNKKNGFGPCLEFEIWNLRFICNLVLGICDLRHQTPRQSRRTLAWPKGPGFLGQNKGGIRI